MLAGVASGLASYLGADVTLIRIALLVLLFVGGIGLPLYLACWLLIPDERAGRSVVDDFAADVRSWRD
jgi:phage shock protein PspC (stress-responsive transcriptional regulator)